MLRLQESEEDRDQGRRFRRSGYWLMVCLEGSSCHCLISKLLHLSFRGTYEDSKHGVIDSINDVSPAMTVEKMTSILTKTVCVTVPRVSTFDVKGKKAVHGRSRSRRGSESGRADSFNSLGSPGQERGRDFGRVVQSEGWKQRDAWCLTSPSCDWLANVRRSIWQTFEAALPRLSRTGFEKSCWR